MNPVRQEVIPRRIVYLFGAALLGAALVVLLMRVMVAHATTTFTVNSTIDAVDATPGNGICETATGNGICTVRAAIMEANALSSTAIISIPAGVYTITIPGSDDADAVGDWDISSNLTINGSGVGVTILDGGGVDRVLHVTTTNTPSVTIQGLTVRNGAASITGAIENQASLTLNNVEVAFNAAGGIHNGGVMTVTNSSVHNNQSILGGGIRNAGTLTATLLTVSNNSSTGGTGGGGIYNQTGALTLTQSLILSNSAVGGSGGALFLGSGAVDIEQSSLLSNTAHDGGGVYNGSGNLTMSGTTIAFNQATHGGGLTNNLTATIVDSTLSRNHATGAGGGISDDGSVILNNVTIFSNTAGTSSGGVERTTSGGFSVISTTNSIIAGNLADGVTDNCFSAPQGIISGGHNVIGTGCSSFTTLVTPTEQLNVADPKLGPLQDNGGPTWTNALLVGSVAIDWGNPGTPGSGNGTCELLDQRGSPRVGTCDSGAFELSPIALTKTDNLNLAKYDHVGQVVTYTLTATNTGSTTLHNVTVTDNPALASFGCNPVSGSTLAPSAAMVCTGTHTITQADLDAGSFADTGSATSTEATALAAHDTITAIQIKTLALTKRDNLNPTKYDHVGQVVTYTLTATNTGSITLHNVTVTDNPTLASFGCNPNSGSTLAPGTGMVCTGTHTITQADLDAGSFTDTASATSTEATALDAHDTITATQIKSLALTKSDSLNLAKYDHVGQVVTYTLRATNSGSITLHNVTVTDNPALASFGCNPISGSALAPGIAMACTGTHTITQADLDAGSFADTASATSTEATALDAHDTITATQTKSLALTKSDNLNSAMFDHVGQVVTYTLRATNTGSITLHNVTVSDNPTLAGLGCNPANGSNLAPNAAIVCTGTHTLTQADLNAGSFADTASATSTEATAPDAHDTIYGRKFLYLPFVMR